MENKIQEVYEMVKILKINCVTLGQVEEELEYRDQASTDSKWDDDLYLYTTSELEEIETHWNDTKEYKCMICGKFISEDEGITTLNGLWVCDNDTCRALDGNNDAIEKQ